MKNRGGKRLAHKDTDRRWENLPEAVEKPAETEEGGAGSEMSRGRRLWHDYGYLVGTLAVVFVLFRVLLQLAYVPSGSMETTIPTKSLLVGWRLPYVVSDPLPERGNIVTFWSEEMDRVLVKRVIGLPGETVSIKDGFVYINGEKLDEDYLPVSGITQSEKTTFEVPAGHIFAMGDNRTGSNDARFWKQPYISVDNIRAKVMVGISVLPDNSWRGVRVIH